MLLVLNHTNHPDAAAIKRKIHVTNLNTDESGFYIRIVTKHYDTNDAYIPDRFADIEQAFLSDANTRYNTLGKIVDPSTPEYQTATPEFEYFKGMCELTTLLGLNGVIATWIADAITKGKIK